MERYLKSRDSAPPHAAQRPKRSKWLNIPFAARMAQADLRKETLLQGLGHIYQPRALLPEAIRQEEQHDRKNQYYHSRQHGPGKEEDTQEGEKDASRDQTQAPPPHHRTHLPRTSSRDGLHGLLLKPRGVTSEPDPRPLLL